jgi:hypothetical protein
VSRTAVAIGRLINGKRFLRALPRNGTVFAALLCSQFRNIDIREAGDAMTAWDDP